MKLCHSATSHLCWGQLLPLVCKQRVSCPSTRRMCCQTLLCASSWSKWQLVPKYRLLITHTCKCDTIQYTLSDDHLLSVKERMRIWLLRKDLFPNGKGLMSGNRIHCGLSPEIKLKHNIKDVALENLSFFVCLRVYLCSMVWRASEVICSDCQTACLAEKVQYVNITWNMGGQEISCWYV